jgi:hypothetical protein
MARNATDVVRIVKYLALDAGAVMVAGIATVMQAHSLRRPAG